MKMIIMPFLKLYEIKMTIQVHIPMHGLGIGEIYKLLIIIVRIQVDNRN